MRQREGEGDVEGKEDRKMMASYRCRWYGSFPSSMSMRTTPAREYCRQPESHQNRQNNQHRQHHHEHHIAKRNICFHPKHQRCQLTGVLVTLIAIFGIMFISTSTQPSQIFTENMALDDCADTACCLSRYPGNAMIGQGSMFDDSCPWGTATDGGLDCLSGDKCRWCCQLPLDDRCMNKMHVCPSSSSSDGSDSTSGSTSGSTSSNGSTSTKSTGGSTSTNGSTSPGSPGAASGPSDKKTPKNKNDKKSTAPASTHSTPEPFKRQKQHQKEQKGIPSKSKHKNTGPDNHPQSSPLTNRPHRHTQTTPDIPTTPPSLPSPTNPTTDPPTTDNHNTQSQGQPSASNPPPDSAVPSKQKSGTQSTSSNADETPKKEKLDHIIASLMVAFVILGSLSIALCVTCCERHFRERRQCCCCSLQFSFRQSSSCCFGDLCCCKRYCIFLHVEKNDDPANGRRDEFQYIDEQCEPVSRAVNLGKDVVG
mmetsp:Transcript_17484/g.31368  ORF Transcript_17484/g.31368 Transcript_17484/m.31368 type:complete len:479 (+) Transcript_17484:169-1605(+)